MVHTFDTFISLTSVTSTVDRGKKEILVLPVEITISLRTKQICWPSCLIIHGDCILFSNRLGHNLKSAGEEIERDRRDVSGLKLTGNV